MLSLIILNCSSEKHLDLDALNKKEYSFKSLPDELRNFVEANIEEIEKESDFYAALDSNLNMNYKRSGSGRNWLDEIKNNFHYFKINGSDMKLRGNQGEPFIIFDSILYYTTELNSFKDKFREAKYVGIDLRKSLKE